MIVDESSMIDIDLMSSLLVSEHQLFYRRCRPTAPVGPGQVFKDLMKSTKSKFQS